MLDHLIKKNLKVKLLFDDEKGEQRLTFIKELIYGPLDKKTGVRLFSMLCVIIVFKVFYYFDEFCMSEYGEMRL